MPEGVNSLIGRGLLCQGRQCRFESDLTRVIILNNYKSLLFSKIMRVQIPIVVMLIFLTPFLNPKGYPSVFKDILMIKYCCIQQKMNI